MGRRVTMNLCKKEFWNGFCSPRYPGVYIILILVLLDTIYACGFIIMSTYYDNFSNLQHAGHLTMVIANVIVIVTGFLAIHFLTLKPTNTKLSYCIFLHVSMIFALLLWCATIALMTTTPKLGEIRAHTERYVSIYHRAPYMMRNVFVELQCCGIQKFGDVFKKVRLNLESYNTSSERKRYYRIPPACCRKNNGPTTRECYKWTDELIDEEDFGRHKDTYLNQNPCFQAGETFAKLRTTNTYATYKKIVIACIGLLVIILGIVLVINYYIWYRFPRQPAHLRPSEFLANLQSFICCRYGQLKKRIEEGKKRQSAERSSLLEAGPKPIKKGASDFSIRHNMIMHSLQNLRAQNREMRQMDRKLILGQTKSNVLMVPNPTRLPHSNTSNPKMPVVKEEAET